MIHDSRFMDFDSAIVDTLNTKMNPEKKLIHVEYPEHPNRCQAVGKYGQCPYYSVEGQIYCQRHGGGAQAALAERKQANQYRLQIWQQRLDEFTESNDVKSLRSEIGLLRVLMEEIWNKCENPTILLINSGRIGDLATRIQNLVATCDKLEAKSGNLMDKTSALAFASRVVEIISLHVTDPEIIDKISGDIIDALSSVNATVVVESHIT